jgi:hypothetical protein
VQERTFWGRESSVYLYFEQFRITFHVILRSYTFKVENFCLIYTFLWNKNFHLQFCAFTEQAISCHAMQNAHKWIILITMWNATKWFLYADFLRVLITIRFPFIHKSALWQEIFTQSFGVYKTFLDQDIYISDMQH